MLTALITGIALLTAGSEFVVRGAAKLASQLGVPPLLVGLTVVAIGTSTPELVVGIDAARAGSGGLAIGNIAGTNMVNVLFILGLNAAVSPIGVHLQMVRLDVPVMIVSAVLLWLLALDGTLDKLDGVLMLTVAVVYTIMLARRTRSEEQFVEGEFSDAFGDGTRDIKRIGGSMVLLLLGILIVIVGGDLMVRGSIGLARWAGVSDATIGLSVVAIGTSAPEMMISVLALLKGERDVAVGNLLGSSIYNIVVILAVTCLAVDGGIAVDHELLMIDLPLIAGVALLCLPVFASGNRVSRTEGIVFVAAYALYLATVVALRS